MSDFADEVFATFQRRDGVELRVILQQFEGRTYLHLRRFVTDDHGQKHATKHGIALYRDELAELSDAIDSAILTLEERETL